MPSTSRPRFILGLLLATTTLGGAAVCAQTGAVWDPTQLPETKGTVKQYTLTPRGDVDGLILTDGTEVKLPPHLTGQIVFAIRPGDAVSVHGLKARALPLIDAASIKNDATGATVLDSGPPDRNGTETTLTGKIATALHGKRGEVNGALLDNGVTLRLPPAEAARWPNLLQAGQTISVRGVSLATPLGTVVDVRAMGASPEQLTLLDVKPPKGPKGPKGPKHGGPGWFDGFASAPPPRG
jgi:hypothetical protein